MNPSVHLKRPDPIHPDLAYLIHLQRPAAALHLSAGRPRSLMAGAHVSHFQGRGMEFDEVRLYQPGDDIRSMDWRVTARTGKPHTKLFREERERPALLLVDLRPPMFFATHGALKSVVAAECASLLAWSVMQQGDRVGGLLFDGEHTHLIRPARARRGVLRFLGQMIELPCWRQRSVYQAEDMSLQSMLHRGAHAARSGSLMLMISDGRGMDRDCMAFFQRLLRHHAMVFVLVYDPFEADLPGVGVLHATDGHHQRRLDTSSAPLRQQHQARFFARRERLRELARMPGFVLIECATNDDPLNVLQTGLSQ